MIRILLSVLSLGIVVQNAFAGWASSGGELLQDHNNPWFVENVSVIKACVIFDSKQFSVSKESATSIVQRSFKYWTEEFKFARNPHPSRSRPSPKIATQTLEVQNECDGTADIEFRFGELTSTQKEFLQDPRKYAAVSVRTHYSSDEWMYKNKLRGKGFVYVSPDIGENRYQGRTSTVEKAWEDGILLYRVLTHEWGHIFGIAHSGLSDLDLMHARFVENVLDARILSLYPELRNGNVELPFFREGTTFTDFYDASVVHPFWGVAPATACTRIETSPLVVRAYACPNEEGKIATVFGAASLRLESILPSSELVTLFLTPLQTVYTVPADVSVLVGPRKRSFVQAGDYVNSITGSKNSISVSFQSGTLLTGIYDGKIVSDLLKPVKREVYSDTRSVFPSVKQRPFSMRILEP